MKGIYVFLFFLIASVIQSAAQDIKLMDYASQYAKLRVSERKSIEVRYNEKGQDSSITGFAIFNEQGLPIQYTEYFARGRKMAEYYFEYDNNRKLSRHYVKTVFNDWEPLEFKVTFDKQGRISSRELPEQISNFWKRETFSYSNTGTLIKSEHWVEQNGKLIAADSLDYPPHLKVEENSLTYIADQNGLLILHQLYNSKGKVDRCRKYEYSFR